MEKKYLNFFDNIDLTCLDKENIRNEILYKKSNNTIHKFTFVIPLVVIMFCCCLGVSAKVIIDHFELRNNDNSFEDKVVFSEYTVIGALAKYISTENDKFQPMNANFGILPDLDGKKIRDKRERYTKLAERSLKFFDE